MCLEFRHLDSIYSTLITFIAKFTTASVLCLLQIVGGKQTVYNRNILHGIEMSDTLCHTLAYIVEVWSLASDDASEDDNGIEAVVLRHLLCAIDELEATWNGLYMNVFRQCSMLFERIDGTLEQGTCNFYIPFRHHYAEAHVTCIGHVGGVIVGKVV